MAETKGNRAPIQHVFIIGAKSIGQYGGYETFVDRLIQQHEDDRSIQYHIACKANGDGIKRGLPGRRDSDPRGRRL